MNSMRGRTLSALFLIFCLIHISGIRAAEKPRLEETPLETLRKIEIFPSQVFLGGQRNTQQLVVEGYYGNDGAFHADTVLIKHNGVYRPPAPGETPTAANLQG